MKTGIKYFIITIIVIAALIGAYFAYTNISGDGAQITKASETVTEQSETLTATDFKVIDKNANDVLLSEHFGKPVVINFWATWCGYCVRELPEFESAYRKYGEQIDFMMIDLTDGDRETIQEATSLIKKDGYTFPVYFDTYAQAQKAYETYSIPLTVFIKADGTVFEKIVGALDEDSLNQKLEQLLSAQ